MSGFLYEAKYIGTMANSTYNIDMWISRNIETGSYIFASFGAIFKNEEDLIAFKLRFGL